MIINGRAVNPGQLRTPVLLAPRTVSVETGGFQQPGPDTARAISAWARWTNAHGVEVWSAQAAGYAATATVLLRHHPQLDATWYVSKDNGSTWYEAISIDNIRERNEYMEIKIRRMEAR